MRVWPLCMVLATAPSVGLGNTSKSAPPKVRQAAEAKGSAAGKSKQPPSAKTPGASGKPVVAQPSEQDAGTPSPRPAFRWDIPGVTAWVESPGLQVTDGVPMHLQLARSSWQMDPLIQHMVDRFRAAGLFISSSPEALNSPIAEPMLTALDTQTLTAYTVIFQKNQDNTVTLILGTSDVSKYTPAGSLQLEWAPVMAGAEQVTRSNLEGSQMAMYAVKATAAEVREFYQVELRRAGFAEDPEQPGVFQRGTEQLTVRTQPEGDSMMVGLYRKLGVQPK
ncbi:hypothetical protein [Myxococcus sp. SDU36]|uniref:hypothetical protein n=1 Tax=Myxococcus sp. SDU36 TaxID=2831967 RepID=UPI0025438099|nr:hypothetical protein [Myxococcus sp. SDU36]WIG94424.1 hypothetical protein KGD87_28385 [Myxococcus sp. SDU36]